MRLISLTTFKTLIILSILTLPSCESSINETSNNGVVVRTFSPSNKDSVTYRNKHIGWLIIVTKPESILSRDTTYPYNKYGAGTDPVLRTDCLSFHNNKGNFTSYIEPYNESRDGKYTITKNEIHAVLYVDEKQRYSTSIDTTSGNIVIDGITFRTFTKTYYNKEGEAYIHNTTFYTLLKGYDFEVNITHQLDDSDGIIAMFLNSKFAK